MEQVNDRLIIDNTFDALATNVEGYPIGEMTVRQAKSEKFQSKLDLTADMARVLEVLKNRGKVYYFTHKGRVKALYLVRRTGTSCICDEAYFSEDVVSEPAKNLMDQEVVFLMAQWASWHERGSATYFENAIPKLKQKAGSFNWILAIGLSALFSTSFCLSLHSPAGIMVGSCIGFAVAMACRMPKYEYEKANA